MAAIGGGSFRAQISRISITIPTLSSSSLFPSLTILQPCNKKDNQLRCALQESSTSTVATEKKSNDKEQEDDSKVAVPAKKPKPAAAVVKPLKQMMEEDVIPPLKAILEAQDDISEIDLSFQDDKRQLEGYFLKKGIQYSFWAFFPTGNLTGAKGFSISSYGSGPSTVEPFLVDERKPTANHVVFWVEKRLAAQGIIPVWNQ